MSYTPPPFPAGLAPGKSTPSARELQRVLKLSWYMPQEISYSDTYGPHTMDAVKAFHDVNPQYASGPDDPAIGPHGWDALHRMSVGAEYAPQGEPPADYTRTTYGGHTVNQRTKYLLEHAAYNLGLNHEIYLTQGSYNNTVSASAGTHSGGGVVDVDPGQHDHWELVKALRFIGFAAWYRTPSEGPWGYHIHACAIGDAQMASSARSQVHAYFNGRNGLANNGPDSTPASIGRPRPEWAAKYR